MRATVLETRNVTKTFKISAGFMKGKRPLHAVNGIDLKVEEGDVLALVGESGCGKTTFAKMLMGLMPPSSGEVLLDGTSIAGIDRVTIASRIQPIFQDPYSSLNPRKTIKSIIELPLVIQGGIDSAERDRRVTKMMDLVGLPARVKGNYPSQMSGGQRQRVAIARALVNDPRIVICDEPTSALDVSVQSQILNLLADLRRELNLTYIIISHDLSVVEHMATRVAVMYLGRIVEENTADNLFDDPRHPYSVALLESVLTPVPGLGIPDTHLGAAFPNPLDIPSGCRFHPRCPKKMPQCDRIEPARTALPGGIVECLLFENEEAS